MPATPKNKSEQAILCTSVKRVTLGGLVINLALSAIKLAAGLFGNSQAMVADAIHSLSDSATDVAILFGVRFWSAPPDDRHPYGHWRIETLITTVIGLVLIAVAIGISVNSIQTIHDGHVNPPAWMAFYAAILSLVVKELLYQWTARTGRRLNSSAVVANAWHHRSDAMSSIPAAIAILTARLKPEWAFVDHIGAIAVSAFVLYAAWGIIRSATGDLTDEAAPDALLEQIRAICHDLAGVSSVHAVRTRKVGPGYHLDLHVLVNPVFSVRQGHDIATAVKHRLIDQLPQVRDVIVHIEPDDE
jgi:cation diffusion facilitator family transporter